MAFDRRYVSDVSERIGGWVVARWATRPRKWLRWTKRDSNANQCLRDKEMITNEYRRKKATLIRRQQKCRHDGQLSPGLVRRTSPFCTRLVCDKLAKRRRASHGELAGAIVFEPSSARLQRKPMGRCLDLATSF